MMPAGAAAAAGAAGLAGGVCAVARPVGVCAAARPDDVAAMAAARITCCALRMIFLSRLSLAIFLERQLAVVLPQEVQEPLVVARFHVEQAQDDFVVAARI